MNFSLYIAKRYLRTSSKNNAINIITRIASFGIVVGAMALFVVLSVFSGLKDFSLSFSNDFDPDLKIIPKHGKSFFLTSEEKEKIIRTYFLPRRHGVRRKIQRHLRGTWCLCVFVVHTFIIALFAPEYSIRMGRALKR